MCRNDADKQRNTHFVAFSALYEEKTAPWRSGLTAKAFWFYDYCSYEPIKLFLKASVTHACPISYIASTAEP